MKEMCSFCKKVINDIPYHDIENNTYMHMDCRQLMNLITEVPQMVEEALNARKN